MCLNEPGTTKENEHRFFEGGIPVPNPIDILKGDKINLSWDDENTIIIDDLPFNSPVNFTLSQKS